LIFLDTNIFVYAAGASHAQRPACAAILRGVANGSIRATTNTEVVQEILYLYTRRGERDKGLSLARDIIFLFPELLPVTGHDVLLACDLMRRYAALGPRDAIHAATMLANTISKVASVDEDFDIIGGIQRVSPQSV
jgi:hypothetical protein